MARFKWPNFGRGTLGPTRDLSYPRGAQSPKAQNQKLQSSSLLLSELLLPSKFDGTEQQRST